MDKQDILPENAKEMTLSEQIAYMEKQKNTYEYILQETIKGIEELRKLEKPQSGNPHVFATEGFKADKVWILQQCHSTGRFYEKWTATIEPGIFFRAKEAAEAWADALNVMMELRVQPGACAWEWNEKNNKTTWMIFVNGEQVNAWPIAQMETTSCFSGCFDSDKSAMAAIKAVGEDKIRKAAFTLAGRI